jgi:hypothetical protein
METNSHPEAAASNVKQETTQQQESTETEQQANAE